MAELKEVFDMATKQAEPDQDSWTQQEERQRRASRNRRWSAFALVAALIAAAALMFIVSRPTGETGGIANQPTGATSVPFVTIPPMGAQIITLDGTPIQQFPGSFSDVSSLKLSPDGTTFAYVSSGAVHTVGVDGTNDRTLTSESASQGDGQYRVSWSPDGSKLAYVSAGDIYVMDADGSGSVQLTHSAAGQGSYYPVWSPDGSTILFWGGASSGRDGGPSDAEIYTIPATGGTPTRLTHDDATDFEPTWSPDGTQIAYWHDGTLWVMQADGGQPHRVASANGSTWAPSWSPDGTKIAFLVYDGSERSIYDGALLQVRYVTLSSGKVTGLPVRVETDGNGPTWTTNGTLLVNRYD